MESSVRSRLSYSIDAREILTRHDTRFTDGNLAAANVQVDLAPENALDFE